MLKIARALQAVQTDPQKQQAQIQAAVSLLRSKALGVLYPGHFTPIVASLVFMATSIRYNISKLTDIFLFIYRVYIIGV